MSEKLSAKRCRFSVAASQLMLWINEQPGYSACFNEVKRSSAQARENVANGIGISNSLHLLGLAVDIVLYKDGVYQTDSEAYRLLGEKWKSMGPDHCWGGDFKKQDGNHISIEHNGVK